MTVGDWRPNTASTPNAEVALEVEADRFIADYLDAVERLAADGLS